MANESEQFWWSKYLDVAQDATSDYAMYLSQVKTAVYKGDNPEANMGLIIANNLLPENVLDDILNDPKCPEEFFAKAGEGVFAAQKNFGAHFLQVVSKQNAPDAVLKNCCRSASRLEVGDVDAVVKTLSAKPKLGEGLLTLVAEALVRAETDKTDVLQNLLQHSELSDRVLSNFANFLPAVKDSAKREQLCNLVIQHPHYNETVAQAMVQNGCRMQNSDDILNNSVDLKVWHKIIEQMPENKVLLSESIQLLPHIQDKEQVLDFCQTLLQNKCCTQDIIKTLLHKSSYTEHFHEVCQLLEDRHLLTHGLKDRIAEIEKQYAHRLILAQQRKRFDSYISHPETMPQTMSSEELQKFVEHVVRYPGLQLSFGDKLNAYGAVINHPNCKAQTFSMVLQNASNKGEEVLDLMRAGNQEARQGWALYKEFKQNRADLKDLLGMKYNAETMKALIFEAQNVVKNGNEKDVESFKRRLFANGEDAVYKIDHNAVDWFIKNGTPENLEALNCLRGLYGLKTVVEEYSHADSDITDAKRAIFGGEISAVNQYADKESGEINPHYLRKHTEAFFTYTPDMSKEYHPEDYDFSTNQSWKSMQKEGLKLPEDEMAKLFAEMHMPVESFQNLNSTDMIHYFLESRGVDVENGQPYKLKEFDSHAPDSVRETYWKKVVDNEELVDFISEDLWQRGICRETIDRMWENCRNYGTPTKGSDGKNNVFGISMQIHHCRALKDGGQNEDDNFIIVLSTERGTTVTSAINSHKPLHEYDNPGVALYLNEKNTITRTPSDRRIKILSFPSEHCAEDERVAVYTGPAKQSCCTINREGKVRTAQFDAKQLVNKSQPISKTLYTATDKTSRGS